MTTRTHTQVRAGKWETTAVIALAGLAVSFTLFAVDTLGRLTKSDIVHNTLTVLMILSIAVWAIASIAMFDRKDPARRSGMLKVGGLLMLGAVVSLLLNLFVLNPIAAAVYDTDDLGAALGAVITFGPLDTVTRAAVPLLFIPGLILAIIGYLRRVLRAVESKN